MRPRVFAIDMLRGITIVGMVFYSVVSLLQKSVPFLFQHNVRAAFHPGNLVLPMFLFASGMSVVWFHQKLSELPKATERKALIKRVCLLLVTSFSISFFVTRHFFYLDEVMLNLLLFLPTYFLLRYSTRVIAVVAIGIICIHSALFALSLLPDFSSVYLGGYRGAIFYLPVMLCGVIAMRHLSHLELLAFLSFVVTGTTLALSAPYKMELYPSFITLSISLSLVALLLVRNYQLPALIYLGKRPLRFWVLQFVFIIIPIRLTAMMDGHWRPTDVSPGLAVTIGFVSIFLLYGISRLMDLIIQFFSFLKHKELTKWSIFGNRTAQDLAPNARLGSTKQYLILLRSFPFR